MIAKGIIFHSLLHLLGEVFLHQEETLGQTLKRLYISTGLRMPNPAINVVLLDKLGEMAEEREFWAFRLI